MPSALASGVAVVVDGGPDCRPPTPLALGRHALGRAPWVSLVVDDPLVEPHHVLVEVEQAEGGDEPQVAVLQVAGRVPVTVDGTPVVGWTPWRRGAALRVGASRVVLLDAPAEPAPATMHDDGPSGRRLVRRPRRRPPLAVPAIELPSEPDRTRPPAGGLTAALTGLVGAVVMGAVVGQAVFVVFAAVGAAVTAATWIAGLLAARRAARRARRIHDDAVDAVRHELARATADAASWHAAAHPGVDGALAHPVTSTTWERRPAHGDAFVVTAGIGDLPSPLGEHLPDPAPGPLVTEVEHARVLPDAPVPLDLDGDARCVALVGDTVEAIARSVVVQLAVRTGPADWALLVLARDPAAWAWVDALPHATAVVDARDDVAVADGVRGASDDRRLVVLTDEPRLLAVRSAPLRRRLDSAPTSVVVLATDQGAVPATCDGVLVLGRRWEAQWTAHLAAGMLPIRFHAAGISVESARAAATALAPLVDPEDETRAASALPAIVGLAELGVPHHPDGIVARWSAGGDDPAPATPIGVTASGPMTVDLVRDGPHALVAGTTGSGKSELLRSLVAGLAACVSPEHLAFVLVDYKGGAAFGPLAALPHTVGLVTDLDDGLARRVLVSLDAELRRRERLLRDAGAESLTEYRARPGHEALARLVVVVDEFAALAAELPDFLRTLVSVAQRGRSLGIHLVLATQRPSGVVDDHVRANTDLRIALRLQDPADALDVVGVDLAAAFPRTAPGRAAMRVGADEAVVFQAAGSAVAAPLGELVDAVVTAADRAGLALPRRPWTDPLPAQLDPGEVAAGSVGWVDDPANQAQHPLEWRRDAGHLALVGGVGVGITTALRSLVVAATTATSPTDLHVYVIDARGSGVLDDLAELPHCGGVVRLHEAERLDRVLRRLADALDERRSGAPASPEVLVVIDGLTTLRAVLTERDPVMGTAVLDDVLADGAPLRLRVAAGIDPAGSPAVASRFAQRWVFHLDDPAAGPVFGVAPARLPPAVAGRIVALPVGSDAQIARLDVAPTAQDVDGTGPSPVGVLPARVRLDELGPVRGGRRRPGVIELVVGRRFDDLGPATVTILPGEHVVVVGGPGTGRTNALALLECAFRRAAPGRRAAWWGDGRPHDRALDAGELGMVLVDDADRVDDPGELAGLLRRDADGPVIVAAVRPDWLRAPYGHWLHDVRRTASGVVMSTARDGDGEPFGHLVPRRLPVRPRPGLAWVLGQGEPVLVQLAVVDGRRGSRKPPLTSSELEVVRFAS